MKPKFQHDCDSCIFLGTITSEGEDYDIWTCPSSNKNGYAIVIARFGDDGPEYASTTTRVSHWEESAEHLDRGWARPSEYHVWTEVLVEGWKLHPLNRVVREGRPLLIDRSARVAYSLDRMFDAKPIDYAGYERCHLMHPAMSLTDDTAMADLEKLRTAYRDRLRPGAYHDNKETYQVVFDLDRYPEGPRGGYVQWWDNKVYFSRSTHRFTSSLTSSLK